MSTPTATISRTTFRDSTPFRSRAGRTALVIGVPAAWVVVALIHPMGGSGTVYEELHDKADLWLGVHFAQLVLSLGLASALWITVRGRTNMAATVTRVALPVYLVFFAAFDSVTGMASALAIRHANSIAGPAQEGAASTAEYLVTNHFTADLSPVWAIASLALVVAIAGTAMTLRSAGAPGAVWGFALGGVLMTTHAGALAAAGLASLAVGLYLAGRIDSAERSQERNVSQLHGA